jgi:formamidopyrimidine-DNA glycosylase
MSAYYWFSSKGPVNIKYMDDKFLCNAVNYLIKKRQTTTLAYAKLYEEYQYRKGLQPWIHQPMMCPWCDGVMKREKLKEQIDKYKYICNTCQSSGPIHEPPLS